METTEILASMVVGGIAAALGLMLLGGALDDQTLMIPGQMLALALAPVGVFMARR